MKSMKELGWFDPIEPLEKQDTTDCPPPWPDEEETMSKRDEVERLLEEMGHGSPYPCQKEIASILSIVARLVEERGEYSREMLKEEKRAAEALAMLREVEWIPCIGDRCPLCLHNDLEGHAPDCRLAALIGEEEE